jgi:hypothetical protein
MGRKRREAPKKKRGGLLIGMRGGVQKVARGVSGGDDKPAARQSQWRGRNLVKNVVTGILFLLAGLFLLQRFGVIDIF